MQFVSSRSWQLRVQDILNAIFSIQQRTTGITLEEFAADEMLFESILYKFIVIGEAARNVPPEIQARAPEIPWRLMSDMRNVITHQYFRVKLRIVWDGIQNELPPLVEPLQNLLKSEAGNEL
jgi:uncharacterized protein with HEPN domain